LLKLVWIAYSRGYGKNYSRVGKYKLRVWTVWILFEESAGHSEYSAKNWLHLPPTTKEHCEDPCQIGGGGLLGPLGPGPAHRHRYYRLLIRGSRFLDFLDFLTLTTEFGLAKDQSRKGVFPYFHVFLCDNEFFGPKKVKRSLNRVTKFFSSKRSI
jgi:hypothetical protein